MKTIEEIANECAQTAWNNGNYLMMPWPQSGDFEYLWNELGRKTLPLEHREFEQHYHLRYFELLIAE